MPTLAGFAPPCRTACLHARKQQLSGCVGSGSSTHLLPQGIQALQLVMLIGFSVGQQHKVVHGGRLARVLRSKVASGARLARVRSRPVQARNHSTKLPAACHPVVKCHPKLWAAMGHDGGRRQQQHG